MRIILVHAALWIGLVYFPQQSYAVTAAAHNWLVQNGFTCGSIVR